LAAHAADSRSTPVVYQALRRGDNDVHSYDFPSWWDDNRFIFMFDYGFDEGGEGETLLASAQVGSARSLRRLSRRWTIELKKAGVTFFHSKDYRNRHKGVFKGLSHRKRKALLGNLADLIHKYVDFGVTAHINESQYIRHTSQPFRSEYGAAYSFAIHMVLVAGYQNIETKGRESEGINVLVAHGHRNLSQVIQQLIILIEKPSPLNVKTAAHGLMKEHPILQAADMLAYGEVQKLRGGDLDIYNALHKRRSGSRYRTQIFECGPQHFSIATEGVAALIADRKAFGAKLHAGKQSK